MDLGKQQERKKNKATCKGASEFSELDMSEKRRMPGAMSGFGRRGGVLYRTVGTVIAFAVHASGSQSSALGDCGMLDRIGQQHL